MKPSLPPSPRRMLIINQEFPPLGGGGGWAAKGLALAFLQLGWEVEYLTSHHPGALKEEWVEGIHVHRVSILGRPDRAVSSLLSMFSFVLFGFFRGIALCRARPFHLINTHFVLPAGPMGFLLSRIFHIPQILSLHGGDLYDPTKRLSPHRHSFFRAMIRFFLKKADAVVVQSSDTMDKVRTYYPTNRAIHQIPLPYHPFSFTPRSRRELNLPEDAFLLIAVGRLVPRKGFAFLLQALAQLPEQVHLILVGDGPLADSLQQLALTLNLGNRLIMTGFVDEESKFRLLASANAYVLSSLHEGFGIVLQEAMQTQLPIIATHCGGQVDLITHGHNGLLVPPENPEALAQAIFRLLNEPELSAFLGKNGYTTLARFHPASIAEEHLRII